MTQETVAARPRFCSECGAPVRLDTTACWMCQAPLGQAPEAAPGPHDAAHHFKRFIELMEKKIAMVE